MKQKLFSNRLLALAAVFFCILLISFSGSLWFLRALLGGAVGEYTIGYRQSFVAEIPLPQKVQEVRASFIPAISDSYNRFVYKKDAAGEYIVGIPRFTQLFSMGGDLQGQGWQVRRIGWIVLASNTHTASVPQFSIMGAAREALRDITIKRLPLGSDLIFQADDNFSLHLEQNSNGLHAGIHTQSSSFVRGKSVRVAKDAVLSETTYVALQRDFLSSIPDPFASALERKVSESMGFLKTHPRMITELSSFGPVGLALDGDSIALGVVSENTDATGRINQWINDEQGTRHPIKKAFSLPDKSLGYEYIPGISNAYFNLNKGNNSCLESENYDEHVLLCSKDNAVVLATREGVGSGLVSFLQDSRMSERGIIQGGVLARMGIANRFKKIEYVISDDGIEAWADVNVK